MAIQETEDKLANARQQGQAQFDSIKEMVEALAGYEAAALRAGWEPFRDKYNVLCWRDKADGATWAGTAEDVCREHDIEVDDRDIEEARQRIHEDALSVEVRSGWYVPGARDADTKPAEFAILLCTGGPACRIVGRLSEHGEPETAWLEVQDWFQPWTEMRPLVGPDNYDSEPILLDYARVFYFG